MRARPPAAEARVAGGCRPCGTARSDSSIAPSSPCVRGSGPIAAIRSSVMPGGDELREVALAVGHAERGVARAGQLARGVRRAAAARGSTERSAAIASTASLIACSAEISRVSLTRLTLRRGGAPVVGRPAEGGVGRWDEGVGAGGEAPRTGARSGRGARGRLGEGKGGPNAAVSRRKVPAIRDIAVEQPSPAHFSANSARSAGTIRRASDRAPMSSAAPARSRRSRSARPGGRGRRSSSSPILSTTSCPPRTSPNTVCLPSSHGAASVVTMKNCEPFVFGPALAIASAPRTTLWSLISSSNV